MLIEQLKSLTDDFILAEQPAWISDPGKYAEQVLTTFKGEGPTRMLGSVYIFLERNQGSAAALGFLITLQMLRRWAEEQNDHLWLASQCEAVTAMGHDGIGFYVTSYLDHPPLKIDGISKLIRKATALRGFINYNEVKWEGFAIGAYMLIGVLQYSESSKSEELEYAE